ncbi:MAG: hypothetical protein E4G90_02645 [Gemmatimonadales bacterium]|nr:MAG: hypothetical protein E4G90_02645 [Gemmatimonadales bacterium]
MTETPTFTPFPVKPGIRNREEVRQVLIREYPPLLRDAGIGGTVEVWFQIDEGGGVQQTLVKAGSGHAARGPAYLVPKRRSPASPRPGTM